MNSNANASRARQSEKVNSATDGKYTVQHIWICCTPAIKKFSLYTSLILLQTCTDKVPCDFVIQVSKCNKHAPVCFYVSDMYYISIFSAFQPIFTFIFNFTVVNQSSMRYVICLNETLGGIQRLTECLLKPAPYEENIQSPQTGCTEASVWNTGGSDSPD